MGSIKKFAGQAVTYGLGSILSRAIYYVLVPLLLTKILGKESADFGTYGLFYAYSAVLVALFSFRLDTALFRFGNKGKNLNAAFSTTLIPVILAACCLAVFGFFFSQPIASLLRHPESPRYVRWFAFILAFDVINLIPFAKLRLTNRSKAFTLYKIFNALFSALLVVFFILILPQLSTRAAAVDIIDWVFIANLITSCILFVALIPVWKGFQFNIDKVLLKKMFFYAAPLVIVGMASGFVQFFGVDLQERFLTGPLEDNRTQAGVYEFTRKIAGLFVMFITAFNYAAEPFFFNNSSEEDRAKMYGKICRLFVLLGGLMIISMYLGIDLVKLFVNNHYWSSLYLLPIILMAYLFLGIHYNVSIWYKLSDNTWYGALLSIIGVITTLVISIIYLPRIGYAASAWATLGSYIVMVTVGYLLGQAKYPISYPVKKIIRDLLVISAVLFCAYYLREHQPILVQYTCNILLFAAYASYTWLSEKQEWSTLLRKAT